MTVERLRKLYKTRRKEIRERLADFARVPAKDYFYELAYCILTPQSSAEHAEMAIRLLRERDFLHRRIDPVSILSKRTSYIRFHNAKSSYLIALKKKFPEIAPRLSDRESGYAVRLWLATRVKGLGWKEASHFLRNIGYSELAILDRHILRNLVRLGVIGRIPKTLTMKRYERIEKKFRRFSSRVAIAMDELDLLFWSMETGIILK